MTGRAASTVVADRRATTPAQRRADTPSRPPWPDPPLWLVGGGAMPGELDFERPNAARMYDFFLGGGHNFAADRRAARAVIATAPQIIEAARANRDFLRRAVRFAHGAGVRQFLDLGSGFPLHGSVHDIAHTMDPVAPVVYVDVDPVAVALAQRILDTNPAAGVVHADIRDIVTILDHPHTRQLIDFTNPVCVLLVAVLHFVPGDLTDMMAILRARMSPGSLLVISHGTDPGPRYRGQAEAVRQLYTQTATPISYRTPDEIAALLTGFDPVAPHGGPDSAERPGLVAVNQWRPDATDASAEDGQRVAPLSGFLAAAARKPHRRPPAPTNPPSREGSHIR